MILLTATLGGWYYSRFGGERKMPVAIEKDEDSPTLKKLRLLSDSLKHYAAAKKYNTQTGFLLDMSLESGKNRFFIADLQKDSILDAGLVTHGRCNQNWLSGRKYSNTVGSGCTSLGRYKIAQSYQGKFGLAYKLHGLDSTNSNAFKRFVVLHAHECVPDKETFPLPLCQSDGCPTVSPAFLQKLKAIIDTSPQPVILWIYE